VVRTIAIGAVVLLLRSPAIAQPTPDDEPAPPVTPEPPIPPEPPLVPEIPSDVLQRIDRLEDELERLDRLEDELDDRKQEQASVRSDLDRLSPLRSMFNFYVDVGFFVAGGDGSGIRNDVGHLRFPEYRDVVPAEWVFMGDPLSTGINARGEPADIGGSRSLPGDTVDSGGRPAFLVNSLGLDLYKDVTDAVAVVGLVEFLPRSESADVDVKLAEIDIHVSDRAFVSLGKIDSVLGIEYRGQDAPRRLTVTPSLICRYTCGYPIGASLRLHRDELRVAASLTNGDSFDERFENDRLLAANSAPTASARVSWMLPVGSGMEIGVSGAAGSQEGQPDESIVQWHYGIDVAIDDWNELELRAEFVQGKLPGDSDPGMAPCGVAECLRYKGAYALGGYRATPWAQPYMRVDWRDALHQSGVDFVYISKLVRVTTGARFEIGSRVIAKIEYTTNRELGGIPQFADDVFTSSLVVSTD
jgi:hypothetical protein